VLDIHYLNLKLGPHEVRWEKVERIKRILTAGTYFVPPKQVAAKLLERILECDRANHRCRCSRSGTINDSSDLSKATLAGKSRTNDLKANARNPAPKQVSHVN
jgi:Anti-sigma-28 factor, FlgM